MSEPINIVAEVIGANRPPFDHWCQKNLLDYERSEIVEKRRLTCMYYRKEGIRPIDHAEAELLKKYGHAKDEGCEAWHQGQLAAGVEYPHWDYPHWSGFSGGYLMKDKSNGMGTKDDDGMTSQSTQ